MRLVETWTAKAVCLVFLSFATFGYTETILISKGKNWLGWPWHIADFLPNQRSFFSFKTKILCDQKLTLPVLTNTCMAKQPLLPTLACESTVTIKYTTAVWLSKGNNAGSVIFLGKKRWIQVRCSSEIELENRESVQVEMITYGRGGKKNSKLFHNTTFL